MNRHVTSASLAVVVLLCGTSSGAAQWEQYGAPPADTIPLAQAIAIALANSHELGQAEAALHGAKGMVREAWASVLPEIRSDASYTRNFKRPVIFFPSDPTDPASELQAIDIGGDNAWQANLTLSQPLFEATAFIGVGAAARFKTLETERVRGVAQTVVTRVRQAYFDVLLALEQMRLTDQGVERVRRTLAETRALNRAGLASTYDVLRLEVQLGNLEPNLRRARDAVAAAERQLAVTMGAAPDQPIAVEGRLHEMDLDEAAANTPENAALLRLAGPRAEGPAAFDTLYGIALQRRSDVRQARLAIELEEARYAVERAEYFPKISVFSNYSISAQEDDGLDFFGTGPTNRSAVFSGGVRVELPIFTGFSRSARMQQARANVRQNEELLDLTEKRTANQLRTLLERLDETRQRVASQERAVGQAQRGFEIASAEYRAGVGSQLQITDAELALRQSEFNYAQAVYDYLVARSELDAALGTVPAAAGPGSADR